MNFWEFLKWVLEDGYRTLYLCAVIFVTGVVTFHIVDAISSAFVRARKQNNNSVKKDSE